MSLRPGLLASTSRLVAQPFQRPTSSGAAAAGWVRLASSSSVPPKKQPSLQSAEEQIKKIESAASKIPAHLDMSNMYSDYVFEPIVDPPIQAKWLLKWSFVKSRGYRYLSNGQMADALFSEPNLEQYAPPGVLRKAAAFLQWPVMFRDQILPNLTKDYYAYQRAQAERDLPLLNAISAGNAKRSAERIASHVKFGSTWSLVSEVKKPEVITVRYTPPERTLPNAIAQVVVRFHTVQALTPPTPRGGVASAPRKVDVRENVLFERVFKERGSRWVVKDKLEDAKPGPDIGL